jgi:hypothetical protein
VVPVRALAEPAAGAEAAGVLSGGVVGEQATKPSMSEAPNKEIPATWAGLRATKFMGFIA